MKALFINACVRADSRTRELCEVYIRRQGSTRRILRAPEIRCCL